MMTLQFYLAHTLYQQGQISLDLQLIYYKYMIPFQEPSKEIFRAFFDQLYKMCRYSEEFQQAQIESLEKLMHQKMMHPSSLFKLITSDPQTSSARQAKTEEKEAKIEECKRGKTLIGNAEIFMDNEAMDYDDDLDGLSREQDHLLPLKFSNFISNYLNQTNLSSPRFTGNNQSIIEQAQSSFEEEQKDSYQNHINMANQACSMSRTYCRFHIGGVYNEKATKFRANSKMQYLSNPLLLVKDRKDSKQFVMINCEYAMKYGEVEDVFQLLNSAAQESKKQALQDDC